MKPVTKLIAIRAIAVWSMFRALWVVCVILLGIRWLIRHGNPGPGFGIGLDLSGLIFAAALPLHVASATAAALAYGKVAELATGGLVALIYLTLAVGIWRIGERARIMAVGVHGTEAILLVLYLVFILPTLLLPWPEIRPLAVICALTFLGVYILISIYLLLPDTRRIFVTGQRAAQP